MGDRNDPGQLIWYAEPGGHSATAIQMTINCKQCRIYNTSLMENDGVAGNSGAMVGGAWLGTQIDNCSKFIRARSGGTSYGRVWIIMHKRQKLRISCLY